MIISNGPFDSAMLNRARTGPPPDSKACLDNWDAQLRSDAVRNFPEPDDEAVDRARKEYHNSYSHNLENLYKKYGASPFEWEGGPDNRGPSLYSQGKPDIKYDALEADSATHSLRPLPKLDIVALGLSIQDPLDKYVAGLYNRLATKVFKAELADGRKVIVKLFQPTGKGRELFDSEKMAYTRLNAHRAVVEAYVPLCLGWFQESKPSKNAAEKVFDAYRRGRSFGVILEYVDTLPLEVVLGHEPHQDQKYYDTLFKDKAKLESRITRAEKLATASLRALAAVHACGIVLLSGDVMHMNDRVAARRFMITPGEEVKILDFADAFVEPDEEANKLLMWRQMMDTWEGLGRRFVDSGD